MRIRKYLVRMFLHKEALVYRWAGKNKKEIFRVITASTFIYLLSCIPYLNLILSKSLVIFLALFIMLVLFKVSRMNLVFMGLALIAIAMLFSIMSIFGGAESVGNYLVGIFCAIFIINFLNR